MYSINQIILDIILDIMYHIVSYIIINIYFIIIIWENVIFTDHYYLNNVLDLSDYSGYIDFIWNV